MSEKEPINIGTSQIGKGLKPLFFPDIDVYFKQSTINAVKTISQLHSAGCKIVKGALLHDEHICLPDGNTNYFSRKRGNVIESYRNIIERHVVSLGQMNEICAEAKALNMELVFSIYDEAGLRFALEHDVIAIKIPSSNIVHEPLIRMAAETSLPVILDTGRSLIYEIDRAVQWFSQSGHGPLIMQHSPPGPPHTADDAQLQRVCWLAKRYDAYDGLSDHGITNDFMMASCAHDVDIIEKGICMTEADDDIDIAHALPVTHVSELLASFDNIHKSMQKAPHIDLVRERSPQDRMCLIAKNDLQKDDVLSLQTVSFAFPPAGVPVEEFSLVKGLRLNKAISKGHPITFGDLN